MIMSPKNPSNKLILEGLPCVRVTVAVFFPFLIKPLVRFGEQVVPKRPLNFFMSVVDRSVTERKTAVDDAEVCDNAVFDLLTDKHCISRHNRDTQIMC